MNPRIEQLPTTLLIGMNATMNLLETPSATPELWRGFKLRCSEIDHRANSDFFSMRIYSTSLPDMFHPTTPYERWAAVEVIDHQTIPYGMKPYVIHGGLYAVFTHQGPAKDFGKTMQRIFQSWLPNAKYDLDDREHFEIMPKDYDLNSENAQEDVWVPISTLC